MQPCATYKVQAPAAANSHSAPTSVGLRMEFRVGGTGAGLFSGCGAGFGFLTPLQLHSIPVLGQLAAGLSSGLASADAALGGLGSTLRRRARGAGVRGLGLGAGCGVMVGRPATPLQCCLQSKLWLLTLALLMLRNFLGLAYWGLQRFDSQRRNGCDLLGSLSHCRWAMAMA